MKQNNKIIRISSPARLHLGFLDLHGGLGRLFGSLGMGISDLSLDMHASHAKDIVVSGPDAERAKYYAGSMLEHLNIRSGVHINIEKNFPSHAGLGSGTQMALAVGSAIDQLFDTGLSLEKIATVLKRGNRSGIGIGTFRQGGFIVDAGRDSDTGIPPVISQMRVPDSWRFILVLDDSCVGTHGEEERRAFNELPKMEEEESARICRLLLMQVLPALAEADCQRFGQGISEIQESMGRYFSPAQAGVYTSDAVGQALDNIKNCGAQGIGQSSWGPTGFAIFASETEAYQALKEHRNQFSGAGLEYLICSAQNAPAHIESEDEDHTLERDVRDRI